MPIYEYRCLKTGQIAEIITTISKGQRKIIPCPIHTEYNSNNEEINFHDAEKIFSLTAAIKTPDDSNSSLVYYENKKGEVEWTSTPQQWQPHGFERKEARNHFERLEIEKRIRQQDNNRLSKQREEDDIKRHYSSAARHSDLQNSIRQGEVLVSNPETGEKQTVKLDRVSTDILRKGMDYTNKKKRKKIDSEFRFSVNHNNKNNVRGEE